MRGLMLLLTHFSLISLACLLLTGAALHEVWRAGMSHPASSRVAAYLATASLFLVTLFLDNSLYSIGSHPFYVLEYPTILLETLAFAELCRFVAGFREKRFVRWYAAILALLVVAWVACFLYAWLSGASYYGSAYNILLILPIALIVWSFLLLAQSLYQRTGLFPLRLIASWKALAPGDDAGKAVYGFFLTALVFVLGSTAPVLARISEWSTEVIYGAFFANNLLILSLLIISYLSYVERRINLATKLTSLLFVILMVVFVGVVLLFYQDDATLAQSDADFIADNSLVFEPSGAAQYRAEAMEKSWLTVPMLNHPATGGPIVLELPFEFPFYGRGYSQLQVYPNGQVVPTNDERLSQSGNNNACVRAVPVIAPSCLPGFRAEISTHVTNEIAVIVWSGPAEVAGGESGQAIVQLVLTPEGVMRFNFGRPVERWSLVLERAIGIHGGDDRNLTGTTLTALPLLGRQGEALWFDLQHGQLRKVHALMWPVAIFLVASTFAVVFIFRPLVSRLIVEPLRTIRAGLAQVDEGRLDQELDVATRDEFGDIASGFNDMIQSLAEARQTADEQTEILEAEITYRTIEAAKKIDPEILSKDQVFENRLRGVIEENLSDFSFQVGELADAMAISTRQLHRKVVNLTAQTPAALIRRLRLERARKLLAARAVNVSEAAYKCGFKDVSYFARLFQNRFGKTPSEILEDAAPDQG